MLALWRVEAERPLEPWEWRGAVFAALRGVMGAAEAHRGERSPVFSLRVSRHDPAVAFVGACAQDIADALASALARWELGNEPLRSASLVEQARPQELLDLPPADRVELRLMSPYLQARCGRTAAVFDPHVALRGLVQSWNDNVGLPLPGDPLRSTWHVAEAQLRISTLSVSPAVRLLGLVGKVRLIARGDPDDLQAAAALWRYAAFAGMGSHRTAGGGGVIPVLAVREGVGVS